MKNPLDPADVTGCASIATGKPCESYRFGHHTHWIHADHLGQTPWGWRDGPVASAGDDGWITVDYLLDGGSARVWHHEDLRVPVGTPVRVHEEWMGLSGLFGMVNVALTAGIGAVPAPEHPETWAQEMSVGVVDLSTGRAIDLAGVDAEDQG